MPRQRDWESLAESTKHRYEGHGVGRSEYEAGASLKAARGHETTPERPGAGKGREEYQTYYQLRNEMRQLKREVFGHNVGKSSMAELSAKGRRSLEKGLEYLRIMRDNQYTWAEMQAMYPELQDDSWDWLRHYH
jgi:hypothetical protein